MLNNNMDFLKMINEIENPKPYVGSDSMWNNPYISKFLLEAHIDPDTDICSRKEEDINKTVEKINEMIKPGSKILDLGCGPGLYAEKLAAKGHDVTGVDFSKKVIDYAIEKSNKKNFDITYINDNLLKLDYENEFDFIMTIFCNLGMFVRNDQNTMINMVKKALKPNGIFLFDATKEESIKKLDFNPFWEIATEGGFHSPNPYIALIKMFHFPEEKATLEQHVVITEGNDPIFYRHWDHYYDEEDIRHMFLDNGFSDYQIMDFSLSEGFSNYNDVKFYKIKK